MQSVPKPAAFIHRINSVTFTHLLLHPPKQLLAGHLSPQADRSTPTLHRHGNTAQVHIQTHLPELAFSLFARPLQPFMASYGPNPKQPQCDCHRTLPWLISLSLDDEESRSTVSAFCRG